MSRVQLYSRFERFWHWSQAALVIGLLVTGFVLHGTVDAMDYHNAYQWHVWLGWALVVLTAFAIFWHLTTGQWRHYLPTGEKFKEVCHFYVCGIFRGDAHPFERHPDMKLNPVQRVAYLALKLVIMPVLMATGLLAWSWSYPQFFPEGIPMPLTDLAWWHTLGAFAMMAFLIGHCYLITTGPTPWSHLKAMITGWEELR